MAVQNGADAQPVLPSPATIIDKTYAPLSRPLYIYVKNSAARRPEVAEFLKYYLENIDELAVEGGYDPPTCRGQGGQPGDARQAPARRREQGRATDAGDEVRNPCLDLSYRDYPATAGRAADGRPLAGPFPVPGVLGSGP